MLSNADAVLHITILVRSLDIDGRVLNSVNVVAYTSTAIVDSATKITQTLEKSQIILQKLFFTLTLIIGAVQNAASRS